MPPDPLLPPMIISVLHSTISGEVLREVETALRLSNLPDKIVAIFSERVTTLFGDNTATTAAATPSPAVRHHIKVGEEYIRRALARRISTPILVLMVEAILAGTGETISAAGMRQIEEFAGKMGRLPELPVRGHGGSEPAYDLTELRRHYDKVYPEWKKAKKLYRKLRTDRNWRDQVLLDHPTFPKDLIARLEPNPRLSGAVNAALAKKGGSSAESEIALEHAARLCGVPPYEYSIRWLKSRLKKS
jgi:hypothetical protein